MFQWDPTKIYVFSFAVLINMSNVRVVKVIRVKVCL